MLYQIFQYIAHLKITLSMRSRCDGHVILVYSCSLCNTVLTNSVFPLIKDGVSACLDQIKFFD